MRIALAVAVFLPCGAALAQNTSVRGSGIGIATCGMLLEAKIEDDKAFRSRLAQWATGYATGLNVAMGAEKSRNLQDFVPEVADSMVIAACRQAKKPETSVLEIVTDLFKRLPPYTGR